MDKLTHYMTIIKKQCHSFMTESLKDLDIASAEAPFIKYLSENPCCRQADLSKVFDCDKAHTHRIISKLIEKNIALYSPSSSTISLTQKGLSMVEEINKAIKTWVLSLCNGITKQEEEAVLKILQKCAQNACKLNKEI